LSGQPPFLFQNVSAAADLKPCASCLLRDSAARKGWVISHRLPVLRIGRGSRLAGDQGDAVPS
ncbi:hypothetical protein, partial [Pseudomonas plecoglossicida]|uniref:hypothetical protein n=1 Tax=Pseudomonas plecoglossicida TaxID=70775 RepID=UPI0039E8682C